MNYVYLICAYLLMINVIAVIVTLKDKSYAVKHRNRISERMLMTISVLGGGLGMYIAMITIRHKTRRSKFMLGIPIIVILQAMIMVTLYNLVR